MNQLSTTSSVRYCRRTAPAWASIPRREIILGDARTVLRRLPSGSVDTVVLLSRLLQVEGLSDRGAARHGVVHLRVGRQPCGRVRRAQRVLRPTGSLWLNLGDSYSAHPRFGAPRKSLLLGPERLVIALSERGWLVRNFAAWVKPNPMPSSVRDRLNTAWEPIFLLVRSPRAFFDLDSIRQPHGSTRPPVKDASAAIKYGGGKRPPWAGPLAGNNDGLLKARAEGRSGHPSRQEPGRCLHGGHRQIQRGSTGRRFPLPDRAPDQGHVPGEGLWFVWRAMGADSITAAAELSVQRSLAPGPGS